MRIHDLTPQQWRVACMVADELTDKAIAAQLSIDQRTVAFHIERIASAWGIFNKNARVAIALRVREKRQKPAA